jgi:hypothetical protein
MSDKLNKPTVLVLNRNWQAINSRKGNRLPEEAGLKLRAAPKAPKELPVTAFIRNRHGVPEWKLFVKG